MPVSRILAVITARGGSKRLPGKNARLLAGKPLLVWTAEAALCCKPLLHSIVLSTDDEHIAEIGRNCGVEVPFLRPAELATDNAGSLPVVRHATRFIEERDGVKMDWVLLLQPTSPLRLADDIEQAVALTRSTDCDSVVSVVPIPANASIRKIDANGFLQPFTEAQPPSQNMSPAYLYNGAIYITERETLMESNSLYGSRIRPYVMPPERSIDIDTEFDFFLAELLLTRASSK